MACSAVSFCVVSCLVSGQCSDQWSVRTVVGVLHFHWLVVGFYFRKWSVVTALISIRSVVSGLHVRSVGPWLVVGRQ